MNLVEALLRVVGHAASAFVRFNWGDLDDRRQVRLYDWRMPPPAPKAFKDQNLVKQRLARLHEPHVAPLSAWVETLRIRLGGGEAVPWFDPDGGGVEAQALLLFEAPGARAVGPGSPRPKAKGSGIISPDNNDQTAANTFLLREEAGLDRRCLLHWNIVPGYVGDGQRIRAVNRQDLAAAEPYLVELLGLLPKLKVIVLVGRKAQQGWDTSSLSARNTVPILRCPHPSPRNLNVVRRARGGILEAFRQVAQLLG